MVAAEANDEYQINEMIFSDLLDKHFKVSIACIDTSRKYAIVIAIKSKQEGKLAAEMLDCLTKRKDAPTSMGVRHEKPCKNILMKVLFMLLQDATLTL